MLVSLVSNCAVIDFFIYEVCLFLSQEVNCHLVTTGIPKKQVLLHLGRNVRKKQIRKARNSGDIERATIEV